MTENKEPTQQELTQMIEKGLGKLLKPEEIAEKKKEGQIPENFDLPAGFGVYRVEINNEGFLCITKLLCSKCERNNGEVKKCAEHAKNETVKAKVPVEGSKIKPVEGKPNSSTMSVVTSVVGSTSKPVGDKSNASSISVLINGASSKKKIEGAVTPYAVLSPGIGGAIILVRVKAEGNKYAGPPAKNMHCEKGILIRGPDNIPQFIPRTKIGKENKTCFDKYTEGELIMLIDKALFVPKTSTEKAVKKKAPSKKDQQVEKAVGTKDCIICVQMDVADNGMPVMKIIKEKPVDKEAPIGVILKVNDEVQFVQVGGKEIGGGADALLVPTTPKDDMKKGDVIAVVVIQPDGKPIAKKQEEVSKDAKIIGTVVVGNNEEPVFVAKDQKVDEAIENQNKAATKDMQILLEKAQVEAIAKTTGQTPEHVAEQVSQIGNKKKDVVVGGAVVGGELNNNGKAQSAQVGSDTAGCGAAASGGGEAGVSSGVGAAGAGAAGSGTAGAGAADGGAAGVGAAGGGAAGGGSAGAGAADGGAAGVGAASAGATGVGAAGGGAAGGGAAGGGAASAGAIGVGAAGGGAAGGGAAGGGAAGGGAADGGAAGVGVAGGGTAGAKAAGGGAAGGGAAGGGAAGGGAAVGGDASGGDRAGDTYQSGSNGEVKSVGFGALQGPGGSVFMTSKPSGGGGGAGGAGGAAGGSSGGGGGGKSGAGHSGRAGGAGATGGAGGGNSGGGGNNTGSASQSPYQEVQSVGFGATQYGGSVFMKASSGGANGTGGAGKAAKSTSGTKNSGNTPTGITRGSQGEVKSSFFR